MVSQNRFLRRNKLIAIHRFRRLVHRELKHIGTDPHAWQNVTGYSRGRPFLNGLGALISEFAQAASHTVLAGDVQIGALLLR
jgi:hypothetical protein